MRRLASALRKLCALNDSAHGIALGFALGLGLSLLPIPFLGMTAALFSAPLLRANLPATYAGTAIVNPLTAGPLWFGELWLGSYCLSLELPSWEVLSALPPEDWVAIAWQSLPAFATGAALFVIAGTSSGYATLRLLVAGYRRRRARKDAGDTP